MAMAVTAGALVALVRASSAVASSSVPGSDALRLRRDLVLVQVAALLPPPASAVAIVCADRLWPRFVEVLALVAKAAVSVVVSAKRADACGRGRGLLESCGSGLGSFVSFGCP
jgi:hypothetical protein